MSKGSHPDEDDSTPRYGHEPGQDPDALVHHVMAGPVHLAHVIPVTPDADIDRNTFVLRADAMMGLRTHRPGDPVERPTEEQARASYEQRMVWHRRLTAAWEDHDRLVADLAKVDPKTDPMAVRVLALHSPDVGRSDGPKCQGCPEDCEEGPADWPCETVKIIAESPWLNIEIPAERPYYDRPTAEPVYVSPEDWQPPRSFLDWATEV